MIDRDSAEWRRLVRLARIESALETLLVWIVLLGVPAAIVYLIYLIVRGVSGAGRDRCRPAALRRGAADRWRRLVPPCWLARGAGDRRPVDCVVTPDPAAAGRPGPFMTTMRTDREVIVRLNILLPYTLTPDAQKIVERVLAEAADRIGGRITMWDLLYTDVPVSQEVPPWV